MSAMDINLLQWWLPKHHVQNKQMKLFPILQVINPFQPWYLMNAMVELLRPEYRFTTFHGICRTNEDNAP